MEGVLIKKNVFLKTTSRYVLNLTFLYSPTRPKKGGKGEKKKWIIRIEEIKP